MGQGHARFLSEWNQSLHDVEPILIFEMGEVSPATSELRKWVSFIR